MKREQVERMDLDATSSRPLHPAARETLLAAIDAGYADPRRLHPAGRAARRMLDNAREVVAGSLGVRPDEVSFTTSGTDAVHRGLLGLHKGAARRGDTIAMSGVEHSSVLHAATWSQAPTVTIPVDATGLVSPEGVMRAIQGADSEGSESEVGVVAVQSANHEVGTVQPISAIAEAAGDRALFVDAAASLGTLPLPTGWSVAAGSAHKWGGPAGIGVLLVAKGARWRNPFPGDDRIDERVAGFENVPAALAAAAALQAVVSERDTLNPRHHAWIEQIRTAVATLPDSDVVGHPDQRLPGVVTFSFLYVDGEALTHELASHDIGIASGSACTSSTLAPSHVLAAMGALTHGNVRIGLQRDTTQTDVDHLCATLPGVVAALRARVGL